MGERRLERHPAVIAEDLPEIYAFIAKDDPLAADCVLNAIGDTFDLLIKEPEIGVLSAQQIAHCVASK